MCAQLTQNLVDRPSIARPVQRQLEFFQQLPTLAEPEQRYRQNLQQYEQYVAQQIASGAWLDRAQRNEFRYLEEQLHLLPRHLNVIWQRHAPAPNAVPPESDDPQLPPYAARLQQYQQFFLDHVSPDRPLPPQTLQELDSLQQTLQLPDQDVALAEEAALRHKRDRYDAQLQRYQQELLIADDSPGSHAQLQQMQRGLAEADVTIARSIATLLNPQPATPKPVDAPVSPVTAQQVEPSIEPVDAAATSTPPAAQTATEVQPEMLPLEAPKLEHPPVLPRNNPTVSPQNLREIPPGLTLPPSRNTATIEERLRDRSLPLRLLKAILFAIVAVVVGRFVIAQILRILPYPIDNIIGITLFGLVILFSWRQIDRLR